MENEEGYEAIVRGFREELDQVAGDLADKVEYEDRAMKEIMKNM